ncbi:hypothetical protein POG22_15095 [Geitlerinema sp. CS-897]|nr:hypothetical protein [Geitlerinema sp. CS-897]
MKFTRKSQEAISSFLSARDERSPTASFTPNFVAPLGSRTHCKP